jgi:GWxTD domain-containing protein
VVTKRSIDIRFYSLLFALGIASLAYGAQQPGKGSDQQQVKTDGQSQTQAPTPPQRPPAKPKKKAENALDSHYKKWLNEDVDYIITPEERSTFKSLTTDEERENFIDAFWARRNPDPREPGNSFKAEHYRRIVYANEHFASGIPGWRTDRGRTYIVYGEPDGKESHPSGGSYQREFWEGGGETSVYPFERWRYRHIDNVGDDVELEFVDKTFTGEYRLAMDSEEKDALLNVPNAGLTDNEQMGLSKKEDRVNYGYQDQTNFQRSKDAPFERMARYFNVQRPPQIKFTDLRSQVNIRIYYNQLPYTLRTDFIKLSQDQVLVPISIQLDNKNLQFKKEMQFNRSNVNVYGVVSSLTGDLIAEFEDTIHSEYTDETFQEGKIKQSIYQHIVRLRTGQRYKLDLILKDINASTAGSMSYMIPVPKFDGDALQSSSVILANTISTVAPTYDRLEQFVIGDMKVQPNVKSEYVNGQALIPYLQVYNVALDQTSLEPSLQISYTIKSGDKIVKDVEDMRGRSAQFVSGQRVVIVSGFPIKDMEPGKYTLEIRVLDKISNKTLTTSADFQVLGSSGK